MKLAIIGSSGMLGRALVEEARARGVEIVCLGRHEADIEVDLTNDSALCGAIASTSPDVLVNCAAIVNVALCDEDPLLAWQVNARSVGVMAEACRSVQTRFIQISTDHYFTGDGPNPHDETAAVSFLNEYARTKFAGESFAAVCPDHLVLRTNIVGFRWTGSATFAEWAYGAVTRDEEMTLFKDSFVSSIDVSSFSRSLMDMAATDARGLYNLACSEIFSKQQLIQAIADSLNVRLTRAKIGSVRSLSVSRAESCGLDVSRAESVLGYLLPNLEEVVAQLTTEWKQQ